MKLKYVSITELDYEYLKCMMIDAYDDDALLHTGEEYFDNNGDIYFKQLLNTEYNFKKIVDEKGSIIGGICIDLNNEEIISIFIDPLRHNYGYGKCVVNELIKKYNLLFNVKIPSYSEKLYYFFKSCGFICLNEKDLLSEKLIMRYKGD